MANLNFQSPSSDGDPLKQPVSPWSCFPCRRRKIRCDRRYPCSQSSKGDLDCAFPVSGDLLSRLRRLEGYVAKLGSELQGANRDAEASLSRDGTWALNLEMPQSDRLHGGIGGKHSRLAELANVTEELGTLVMHNNESMYVGNWLWGVKHTRQVGVPFFWGPSSLAPESLRPLPSQVFYIWEIFVENVDPFIKVLHVPTIGRTIKEAKALMFAISLAAVTSLREEEVEENFGEDRQTLLAKFRLGTEQALSRAGVLNTTDISTVQAFIIYQETVWQNDGQRATWTLAGLLMRIAVGMGLYRDGSHFPNVSAFDAEIRRRVWYHICLLDSHVGDCEPSSVGITENLFDTKQPSNLNDADITPVMATLPASSDRYTDSTLCVLRCRLWRFGRRFRSSISVELSPDKATTAHRRRMLAEIRKSMAKDLKHYLNPRENQFHRLILSVVLELSKFDHIIHVANNFKPIHGEDESLKAFALAVASLQHMAWALAKKAFVHLSEGMYRYPMWQPLQELMNSVEKHRDVQMQKLRGNLTWAESLTRIGALQFPIPEIREFSNGKEAFDTSATEERLALEIEASISQSERFDVAASGPSQSVGGSEKSDILQAHEDLDQHSGLNPIHCGNTGSLHNQEPWNAHIASGNEMEWLAWDSIFRTEGVP
ncbi:hypothetical protein F5Y09DRAFT_333936 [Xylaria sp. FL1042]|nr:hypothetical protein F5Y09DRAFT_333936 [Xylaria sp. FL1042]